MESNAFSSGTNGAVSNRAEIPDVDSPEIGVVVDVTTEVPNFQVIRDTVTPACHAPSLHNSQPWRWVAEGVEPQLWADPYRVMYATDDAGRELTSSCRAVLDHFRVAKQQRLMGPAGAGNPAYPSDRPSAPHRHRDAQLRRQFIFGITADYDTAPDIDALAAGSEGRVAQLVTASNKHRRKRDAKVKRQRANFAV